MKYSFVRNAKLFFCGSISILETQISVYTNTRNGGNIMCKESLQERDSVFYLVQGYVMQGIVCNLIRNQDSYTFEIEGVGGCGGPHIMSDTQLHHTIFLTREEAMRWVDCEQAYLIGYC